MTVIGNAGTGKTFLIHTLVTAVRSLTQIYDTVIITSPTGMLKIAILL